MRRKLLLADDSITIQRVIELTFADEDVQVIAVGDGKKAIATIEQDRPDIVLADVGMPERDGYEVAAFIKGNPQLSSIPVLLLTGAFEPIDETRARAVGCDGVLVKPFEPQMVINRVKDLLAGRRPAGLWAPSPMAQGPTRQSPASDSAARAAAPPAAPPGPGGSLEDYFDRLDAAFANLEAVPEPASSSSAHAARVDAPPPSESARVAVPASEPAQPWRSGPPATVPHPASSATGLPADVLDGWDPDLTGDPKRVEPAAGMAPEFAARPDVATDAPPVAPAQVHEPPPSPFRAAVTIPALAPAPADVAPTAGGSGTMDPAAPAATSAAFTPAAPAAKAPVPFGPPAAPAAAEPAAFVPPTASAKVSPAAVAPPPAPVPPSAVIPPVSAPGAAPPLAAGPAPEAAPQRASAPAPAPMPSLAEAFAALLSAEQSRVISPSVFGGPGVSSEAVEEIVRRVVVRMGEQAVRETVLDVAERLVREEIERIKASTQHR